MNYSNQLKSLTKELLFQSVMLVQRWLSQHLLYNIEEEEWEKIICNCTLLLPAIDERFLALSKKKKLSRVLILNFCLVNIFIQLTLADCKSEANEDEVEANDNI